MQISAPQPTAPQKFPLKNGQQAFEAKGGVVAPHAKFHNKRFVPPNATQFAPAATIAYPFKQPVIPIGKPKMGSIVNGGGGAVVTRESFKRNLRKLKGFITYYKIWGFYKSLKIMMKIYGLLENFYRLL